MSYKQYIAQYSAIIIGTIGGMAHYLRHTAKSEKPMSVPAFFINAFISGFVAYVVGQTLSSSMMDYNNAIAGMTGFFSYPILDIIENNFSYIFKKFIRKL